MKRETKIPPFLLFISCIQACLKTGPPLRATAVTWWWALVGMGKRRAFIMKLWRSQYPALAAGAIGVGGRTKREVSPELLDIVERRTPICSKQEKFSRSMNAEKDGGGGGTGCWVGGATNLNAIKSRRTHVTMWHERENEFSRLDGFYCQLLLPFFAFIFKATTIFYCI